MKIKLPLENEKIIEDLHIGDIIYFDGIIYTARDAAHARLVGLIDKNEKLPIDLVNAAIYYVGPTPAKPGEAIGSAGPTSSYRMDAYSEKLMQCGLKIMIGKGSRSDEYKEQLKKYKRVYLSAIGGAGALISQSIKKCHMVCYEDLGPEAIYQLEVVDFYAVVTYDIYGGDLFAEGVKKYGK